MLARADSRTTLRGEIIEEVVEITTNGKGKTTRVREGFIDSISYCR